MAEEKKGFGWPFLKQITVRFFGSPTLIELASPRNFWLSLALGSSLTLSIHTICKKKMTDRAYGLVPTTF